MFHQTTLTASHKIPVRSWFFLHDVLRRQSYDHNKGVSVNSTYTESEEDNGVVQYEPQLKTIPVMYIQGESTYVDSGNPTVDVYVGMDYTYQDLDSMAGGFAAASQRTLQDPTGTVHIYDTTTSIQIYLNEQES